MAKNRVCKAIVEVVFFEEIREFVALVINLRPCIVAVSKPVISHMGGYNIVVDRK